MGDMFGAGGGKGGKGQQAPTAPDFAAAADQQSRSSRNDVNSAFGSATWEQIPGSQTAGGYGGGGTGAGGGSGPAPYTVGASGGMLGAGGFGAGAGLDGSGASGAGGTDDGRWALNVRMAEPLEEAARNLMGQLQGSSQIDPAQARDSAIDSAYRMQSSRLDPRFAQARAARETQMANEGFSRGDEGWRTAMDEFGRGENDAYQQALLGAQSTAGNTAFGQSLAANMQPYQQLGAIQGMGEKAGYSALGGAQPAQSLAAAMQQYGGQLQQYGIDQAQKNSKMNGATGLAAMGIMA